MKKKAVFKNGNLAEESGGITRVTVAGYKSIAKEQSIEIRPLTILAGANSSGKSSVMQPLLLMKQTLDSSYDPGALLLNGPNITFSSSDQLLSINRKRSKSGSSQFSVKVTIGQKSAFEIQYIKLPNLGFDIHSMTIHDLRENYEVTLRVNMNPWDLLENLPINIADEFKDILMYGTEWEVYRERCYLDVISVHQIEKKLPRAMTDLEPHIRRIIHLPGLRGNPERSYPVAAVGNTFSGTFENYTASVIAAWQASGSVSNVERLAIDLHNLGLTWKVTTKTLNDTQVEIQVGRTQHPGKDEKNDLVNIADVGLGVSQTLPVLVALHVAKPGQLVYLEQPEIHLHPRAQTAIAQILADAAMRGVRVVAETHSSLLLLGIQTLVAEGKLPPELVKLHWFTRDKDGVTTIRSADLDETGAFGDWPEDFADVELAAESRYLDAAEARQQVH